MSADSVNFAPLTSTMRIVSNQLLLSLGFGVLVWLVWGKNAGFSCLVGSFICVIPNAYLGVRLAMTDIASGAQHLLRSAYLGELGKLALTVGLFIAAFVLIKPLSAGFLLLGYILAQIALWVSIYWVGLSER